MIDKNNDGRKKKKKKSTKGKRTPEEGGILWPLFQRYSSTPEGNAAARKVSEETRGGGKGSNSMKGKAVAR